MSEQKPDENIEAPADPAGETPKETYALIAQYETVDELMAASTKVRDAGYERWDTHTPFPVHGIDGAMGIKTTRLPYIVMMAGFAGLAAGLALQWWTNAVDYPFSISGKPLFGLPAAIPVTFETTILFAALTAFAAALVMNGLPRLHHPLFECDLFKRATDDRFFLVIEAKDAHFDEEKTTALLRDTAPGALETFKADTRPSPIPRPFFFAGMIAFTLALLPLAAAFMMRNSTSDRPRIHPISDMDWQPKLKAQAPSGLFDDGRAMRLPEPGTVAWGQLEEDEAFLTGRQPDGSYLEAIPARVARDRATLERGRQRFEIYCAVCHGHDGQGKGAVQQLADQQGAWEGWAPPSNLVNLHQREGGKIREVGHYYETISMGRNSMRGYAAQISPEDRWAIVYYLKALQLTQRAALDDLTPEMKEALR